MTFDVRSGIAVATLAVAVAAQSLHAQAKIPLRALPAPTIASTDSLGYRVTVRPLSDGRVIVNDIQHLRVLLYDKSLKSYTTLLDTSAAKGKLYTGLPSVNLIPVPGDSTLYVDVGSRSLLLLNPAGEVAHVTAFPKMNEAVNLAIGTVYGTPVLDAKGRLLYRGSYPGDVYTNNAQVLAGLQQQPSYEIPALADSAPIVRVDFDTRLIDTLTSIKIVRGEMRTIAVREADGNVTRKITVNPFDTGDEWAVLPNGTIAILRAHDYHIDWVDADGTRRSSPKMAFDWKRLSDDDKQRKIDSMKPRYEKLSAAQAPENIRTPAGMRRVTTAISLLSPADMSDYEPPISMGAMKVDLDGNLWIVPRTAITDGTGGLRYDVVNAKGVIVERVTIPKGSAIASFEPGGTVILTHWHDGITSIERARLH